MFSWSVIISCLLSAVTGLTYWSEEYEVQRDPQDLRRPTDQLRSTVSPEIKFYSEPVEDDTDQNHAESPLVTPYPLYLSSTKPYAVHEKQVHQKYPLQDYIAKNIPQQSKFIVLDQYYTTEVPRPFSLNVPIQRPYVSLNRDRHETNHTNERQSSETRTKPNYPKKHMQHKQKTMKHSDAYPVLVGTPYPVVRKLPFVLTETKSIPKYIEGKRILYKYNEEPSAYEGEKSQRFQEETHNYQVENQSLLQNKYNAQQSQGHEQYLAQTENPNELGKYQVQNQPIYPVRNMISYSPQNQFSYPQNIFISKPVFQRIPYQFQKQLSYEVEENGQEDALNQMQISPVRSSPYPVVLPYNVALLVPYNVGTGRMAEVHSNIRYYQSHTNKATTNPTISPLYNEVSTVVTPKSKQTVARFYDGHFSKYDKLQQHPVDAGSENGADSENKEIEQQYTDARLEHPPRSKSGTARVGRNRSDYRRTNKSKN